MSGVRVEDRNSVRILTLDRPERRNALDLDDRVALRAALVDVPPDTRAVVLTGGSFFCAGGDISTMTHAQDVARDRLRAVNDLVRTMIRGDLPVVAAVEGGAYGLGFALAMASDYVVAARSSKFAASFSRIGLGPDSGLSYTLPQRVGLARTRELLLTARTVTGEEAATMNIVDELVENGEALDAALRVAKQLADLSVPMVREVRALLSQADKSLDAMLTGEEEMQLRLFQTDEFTEGQRAFMDRKATRKPARGGLHDV